MKDEIGTIEEKNGNGSQVEALKAQVEDLINKWKRAAADYQNLEKRVAKDKEEWLKVSNIILLTKLVPMLDDLERAASHNNDSGLKIITKNLRTILWEEGVRETEVSPGDDFDPHLEECLDVVEGEDDQKVVEVIAKGYIIGERIIRPAKVRVSKKKIEPLTEEAEKELG